MMRQQGATFVIVDNASDPAERARLEGLCRDQGSELIVNRENLGLASALNQGVRRLAERGFSWALLFDQDSEPVESFSAELLATLCRHPEPDRVAVIGTSFTDARTGRRHRILTKRAGWPGFFRKKEVGAGDLPDVTVVVTSGSLVSVADFEQLGGFDESLFIDYVDTDFCLRCRRFGRMIAVSAAAHLKHELGEREQRKWLGFTIEPTNHSAFRHYYISRNRIHMIRRHALREVHWFFFDILAAGLWLFRVMAAEQDKFRKCRAMVLGTWDGLLGRTGICPPGRV